jgi:hypothetical protein
VPRTSLISSGAGAGLTAIIGVGDRLEHIVRATPVMLGLVNDTKVEVASGLDEGQLVATGSITTLSDGQVVAPQVQAVTASIVP